MQSGAARARVLALTLLGALILVVLAWRLSQTASSSGVAIALLATLPLWLPVRGLVRSQRRTYAWATLCVIPYFILGVTEAVANPSQRAWAAGCLALSLGLFVTLIGYLRIRNRVTGDG